MGALNPAVSPATRLAGDDTTASALAWMIHPLWKHPETLAIATAEVRRVCADAQELTMEHMAQLDYVEACAHECCFQSGRGTGANCGCG